MAIIDMNRISLIGLSSDREEILDNLMKLGAVHITDIGEELPETVKDRRPGHDTDEADIAALEENMTEIAEVLKRLEKFDRRKKGLFETRRAISRAAYEDVLKERELLWGTVKSVMRCDQRIASLHIEKNKYSNRVIALSPWELLDIPLEITSTRTSLVVMGYMPRRNNVHELKKQLEEDVGACRFLTLNVDGEHVYICLIYHRSVSEEVGRAIKSQGFTKVSFNGLEGTAAQNILAASARIEEINEECERIAKEMDGYAGDMDRLEVLYDALAMRRDLKMTEARLAGTRNTFMLGGWIPAHLSACIADKLTGAWICEVNIRKPGEEEEFPVLLRNNGIGRSVEAITTMYSPPHPKEPDPNTVVGVFFILFFGLMLGDAGYGLLIILAASLLLKKVRLEDGMRRFVGLMLYCGISAVFWGAMFGGWFGLPQLAAYPLFLNPIEQPEAFLGFTLVLGILHIYVGLGMKSVKLLQQKKYLDVLLDVVIWYVFFTGFVFVVLPYAFGGSSEFIDRLVDTGGYMLAASGAVIVFTHGRKNKGVIRKLSSGIGSLYGVVKFLSDVLSYSRLMALGLATSVIGIIVYDIASMNGLDNPIKWAGFLLIMLAGHALNFAIAALSAYVHSSRLQYIEFFSRFYRGGGVIFKPFKAETKYIDLQEVMHCELSIFGHDR
jgi:V/A-type H+-transporting ATPase subunit I